MVTSLSVFILSTFLGTCVPVLPNNRIQDFTNSTKNYFCPPSGLENQISKFTDYYNDLATLAFNPEEDTIKQLFHQDG